MTSEQLTALGIDSKWVEPLQMVFDKYDMSTTLRQAAFIGQCAHESGNFKTLEENLHYKAESLMKVWPSRFPSLEVANQFANNPEKIANKVYAGRMGNNEEGDGWAFHGRGLVQLTGRDSYTRYGESLGIDLISNPELLLQPKGAALSAGWFWSKHGLNELADAQDYETMTKRINGGLLGLDDRKSKMIEALKVLNS